MKHNNPPFDQGPLPFYAKPMKIKDIDLGVLAGIADGAYVDPQGENLGTAEHPYYTDTPDYSGFASAEDAQRALDTMQEKGEIERDSTGDGYVFPESTAAVRGIANYTHEPTHVRFGPNQLS